MEDGKTRPMGRPPRYDRDALLKERLTILVTREQKEWVIENGGSELVRSLILNEQERREALQRLLVERTEAGNRMLRLVWRNPEEHDEEGNISWGAYGDPFGTKSGIITFSMAGEDDCRIQLSAIHRVQEPGADGVVLWER